jgi:hypothetical protein
VLALDAHLDTVDVGNRANWDFDPFSGETRDGWVLGRGTADQEGGAAAMVTAGRILKEVGLPDDLTLLCTGTVMEEDCDGLCWNTSSRKIHLSWQHAEPTACIYRHRAVAECASLWALGAAWPRARQNAIYGARLFGDQAE